MKQNTQIEKNKHKHEHHKTRNKENTIIAKTNEYNKHNINIIHNTKQ